jgi:nucleotide-binding universal stress UspA family protein
VSTGKRPPDRLSYLSRLDCNHPHSSIREPAILIGEGSHVLSLHTWRRIRINARSLWPAAAEHQCRDGPSSYLNNRFAAVTSGNLTGNVFDAQLVREVFGGLHPMFRSILVPLDGTAEAASVLPLVRTIAQSTGGAIHLLRVTSSASPPVTVEAATYLEQNAQDLRKAGVGVDTSVRRGEPGSEIVKYARLLAVDLITMATRAVGTRSMLALTSVARYVVADSPCPVLVLRARRIWTDRLQTLLVPVDGSPGGACVGSRGRQSHCAPGRGRSDWGHSRGSSAGPDGRRVHRPRMGGPCTRGGQPLCPRPGSLPGQCWPCVRSASCDRRRGRRDLAVRRRGRR